MNELKELLKRYGKIIILGITFISSENDNMVIVDDKEMTIQEACDFIPKNQTVEVTGIYNNETEINLLTFIWN